MAMTMTQAPADCPNCHSMLTADSEEHDYERFYEYWMCPKCGTHVVIKYAFFEAEVYTKKEWEE